MKITTTRFAVLDIEEDRMIQMQRGILGFESYKRFVLLMPSPGEPLLWLQTVDDPALAFVVANPYAIKKDYNPSLIEDELAMLDIRRGEDIVLLSIATVHSQPWQVTANLRAPILINAANRKANQIVLDDPAYPIQYPVRDDCAGGDALQQRAGAGRLDTLSVAMTVG